MNDLLSFFRDNDAWVVAIYLASVLFCSWLGCWIATRQSKGKAQTFRNSLVRGLVGGAAGSMLHPINLMVVLGGLAQMTLWDTFLTCLLWLGIGALLAFPLAITLAIKRTRATGA